MASSKSMSVGDPSSVEEGYVAIDVDQLSGVTDSQLRDKHLFNNSLLSDAAFLVQGERIPVHTFLLRSASCVFDRMFSAEWRKGEDVVIDDFRASPFLSLIRWIYCKEIIFEKGCLLDMMRLASKYMVQSLIKAVKAEENRRFVWSIVAHAMEYEDVVRTTTCWDLITSDVRAIHYEDFLNSPPVVVEKLTSFDSLCIRETELFDACNEWSKAECKRRGMEINSGNQRQVMEPFLKQFAFQTMRLVNFAGLPCEILTEKEQILVFRAIAGRPVITPFRAVRSGAPDEAQPRATFRFTIEGFSKVSEQVSSVQTFVRNLPWRILADQTVDENLTLYLGFYLQCDGDSKGTMWSCNATAELRMIPQKEGMKPLLHKISQKFCAGEDNWGFAYFKAWNDIRDPENGWIKDDSIILEVGLSADVPQYTNPSH